METITGKTMLLAYSFLEQAEKKLEELITSRALASGASDKGGGISGGLTTYEQVDKILDLVNKKISLCNLKVIIDKTLDTLCYEEQLILKMRFIRGFRFEYFEQILHYTKRTYFRRIESALKKFCSALRKEGLTDKWFEEEYLCQRWIKNLYRKCQSKANLSEESVLDAV